MTAILASNPEGEGVWPEDAGLAKAIVMAEVARIVEAGDAVITLLESGTLELRFVTGEIFHLHETTVTRIA